METSYEERAVATSKPESKISAALLCGVVVLEALSRTVRQWHALDFENRALACLLIFFLVALPARFVWSERIGKNKLGIFSTATVLYLCLLLALLAFAKN